MGRYPSGQRGQTVNLLTYVYAGSNPALPTTFIIKGLLRMVLVRLTVSQVSCTTKA
jgi:hypothetical protein